MMVDSHAHIDLTAFDDDRDQVLARAWESGVKTIINVGVDLESSRTSLEMAQNYPGVFTAIGVHPNDVSNVADDDLGWIAELASVDRAVAIGEIGLDFYRQRSPRQRQLEFFRRQLDMAVELDMPVVVHCRNAHNEVLDILDRGLGPVLMPSLADVLASAPRMSRGIIIWILSTR